MTKANEFGTAADHADTVRRAREFFIQDAAEQFDRESLVKVTEFVDELIARKHLSTKFFHDWSEVTADV